MYICNTTLERLRMTVLHEGGSFYAYMLLKYMSILFAIILALLVLSPNLRRGLKQNFVAESGILGFLILFGRFLYEKKY